MSLAFSRRALLNCNNRSISGPVMEKSIYYRGSLAKDVRFLTDALSPETLFNTSRTSGHLITLRKISIKCVSRSASQESIEKSSERKSPQFAVSESNEEIRSVHIAKTLSSSDVSTVSMPSMARILSSIRSSVSWRRGWLPVSLRRGLQILTHPHSMECSPASPVCRVVRWMPSHK